MRFRQARIAWSVIWGITATLLLAVWVRSYFWIDQVTRQDSNAEFIAMTLGDGRLLFGKSDDPDLPRFFGLGWSSRSSEWAKSTPIPFFPASVSLEHRGDIFGWPHFSHAPFVAVPSGAKYSEFILPFWLLTLPVIGLAAAPWFRWRFALRTLLIAMSLLAVVLGLAVYSTS